MMRGVAALTSCLVGVFVLVGWQKHRLDVTTSAAKAVDDSWRGAKVDPFIGSAGTGHTTPGAHLPFGMITLAPLTASQERGWEAAIKEDGWDYAAGYQRGDRAFRGVAHTATSGAGICLGLDVIVSPFRGLGSIDAEGAHPGYYSATVSDALPPATATQRFLREYSPFSTVSRVSIELAAGVRYGIHRYIFLSGDAGGPSRLFFRDANFEHVEPTTPQSLCAIEGFKTFENEWTRYKLFFHAELSTRCDEAGANREVAAKAAEEAKLPRGWRMGRIDDKRTQVQKFILLSAHPASGAKSMVELHVAISYVDAAGARRNFAAERTTWRQLRRRGRARWEEALGTVQVGHPTTRQKVTFDTALYHTMVAPYVHSDADGRFRGPDGGVHTASWKGRKFTYYTFLSTWDTYRAWGPLMCRLRPRLMLDVVRTSLLHHALVGVLPRWTYAGQETGCMPGIHSITLMWQSVAHGLTSRELDRDILSAFEDTVNGSSTFRMGFQHKRANHELREIVKNDGILFDGEGSTQTVSEALEYAIIMRCIGNMVRHVEAHRRSAGGGRGGRGGRGSRVNDARGVGEAAHERWPRRPSRRQRNGVELRVSRYERLSTVYQRLWDNATGYMGGFARRRKAADVHEPPHSRESAMTRVHEAAPLHATTHGLWTEGCALQWLFHVMHDFTGLRSLVGRSLLLERLQLLFTAACTSELPDTTGLIGCYAHGNEPSHHAIFWFFLLGRHATAYTYLEQVSVLASPRLVTLP